MIAAGSAVGGVFLKMAYDAIIERIHNRKENEDRFVEERKDAYDDFLRLNKEHVLYREKLKQVTLIARAGRQVRQEVLAQFPESQLPKLVEQLEKMRRLARTHEIVKIAERIIALHGDAATALRYYLQSDGLSYGLPLFLADRLGEDQALEFIAEYRRDLRLGHPKGADRNFPMVERLPIPLPEAERALQLHLRADPVATADEVDLPTPNSPRPLTEKDARALESPQYQALILEQP